MNNTLTAKEWLEKELIKNTLLDPVDKPGMDIDCYSTVSVVMEDYANYRTKILEDKFSKYWKEAEMRLLELEGRLKFIENIYEGSK